MEPYFKTEQKAEVVPNGELAINNSIRENPDWQVQSMIAGNDDRVIILFTRIVTPDSQQTVRDMGDI